MSLCEASRIFQDVHQSRIISQAIIAYSGIFSSLNNDVSFLKYLIELTKHFSILRAQRTILGSTSYKWNGKMYCPMFRIWPPSLRL